MSSRFLGRAVLLILAGCRSESDDHGPEIPLPPTFPLWNTQQRVPTLNHLTGVRAANANQVIVVGDVTALFRSDDGGTSWTQQDHNPRSRGGHITAVDGGGSSFIAVGVDQVASRGSRWWRSSYDVQEWLTADVDDMDTTDNGRLLTAVDLVAGDLAFLLREDGTILYGSGVTGQVFDADPTGTLNWYSIDFIGLSGTGHVAGQSGQVKKSTDGGLTWPTTVTIAGATVLRKIQLIVTTPNPLAYSGYACGDGGKVFRSTNSGANWADVSPPATAVTLRSMHFPPDPVTTNPPNEDVGWVVGDGGTIRKTIDAGMNWSNQTITPATTVNLNDIFMVNFNEGFVVGNNGTVARTMNGGTTWTLLTTGSATAAFKAIDFSTDGTNGIAVADGGLIYKSLNGGATWTLSTTVAGTPNLRGVGIPRTGSGTVAYVCGDNGTLRQNADFVAGDTWTIQTLPVAVPAATNLRAVVCPGADTLAYVSGANANLITTTDGATWSTVAGFPGGGTTYDSLAASPAGTTLVAGGNGGRLVFSLDSGTTWTLNTGSGQANPFTVVQAPTDLEVFGLTSTGTRHKATIAAGAPPTVSWTPLTGTLPAGFGTPVGMAFPSTALGIVVSATGTGPDFGRVAVTTDGGATWGQSYEHTFSPFRAIRMLNTNIGWLVGDNGTILKTLFGGLPPPPPP